MKELLVEVCAGTHCTMLGSINIIDAIHSLDEIRRGRGDSGCNIKVLALPCMNLCKDEVQGPFVRVAGQLIQRANSEDVMAELMRLCQEQGGEGA